MPRSKKRHRRPFGSIRLLPSGKYQARYRTPDGVLETLGTFRTRTEADEALAVVQASMVTGTWHNPQQGEVTVAEYVDHIIETRTDLRPRTQSLYRRLLREWIDAPQAITARAGHRVVHLGGCSVRDVTPAIVREWHAAVQAEARRRAIARHDRSRTSSGRVNQAIRRWAQAQGLEVGTTGRIPAHLRAAWEGAGGLSQDPDTPPPPNAGRTESAQAYRLLHTAFVHAVEDGLVPANPCKLRHAGQADEQARPDRQPATVKEIAVLADHMPPRYRAAVWVAAFGGLRAGELFALQRKHVDLVTGELRVVQALEAPGTGATFGPVKSKAGRRTVAIGEPALGHLQRHMEHYTEPGGDALVFATTGGLPLSGGGRTKLFARARSAAGRPDLHWHDLRHTGAVLAAKAGATLAELQARFGHASARAAMRYQHALPGSDQRLAARISEYFEAELAMTSREAPAA